MRTTVDLPPLLHARAREIALERGASLSDVVADLAARGLGSLGEGLELSTDPSTGWPVLHVGRAITSEDVAELIDEE